MKGARHVCIPTEIPSSHVGRQIFRQTITTTDNWKDAWKGLTKSALLPGREKEVTLFFTVIRWTKIPRTWNHRHFKKINAREDSRKEKKPRKYFCCTSSELLFPLISLGLIFLIVSDYLLTPLDEVCSKLIHSEGMENNRERVCNYRARSKQFVIAQIRVPLKFVRADNEFPLLKWVLWSATSEEFPTRCHWRSTFAYEQSVGSSSYGDVKVTR